ncbi:MAG: S-layer homology domain-containing protein [Oscillospiraceae bacterium]|nr:S-layer homology domain-containing protein [Oscillospiraceae bacterium]
MKKRGLAKRLLAMLLSLAMVTATVAFTPADAGETDDMSAAETETGGEQGDGTLGSSNEPDSDPLPGESVSGDPDSGPGDTTPQQDGDTPGGVSDGDQASSTGEEPPVDAQEGLITVFGDMSPLSDPPDTLGGAVTISISDGHTAPRVGDTLTADISGLTASPDGYEPGALGALGALSYTWTVGVGESARHVDGTSAWDDGDPGAYAPITYRITTADIGSSIKIEVSAENATGSVSSGPTAVVISGYALDGTKKPTISISGGHAAPQVGDTLTANVNELNTSPAGGDLGVLSYVWKVTGGATESGEQQFDEGTHMPMPIIYVVKAADVGKTISVAISTQYATGTVSSAVTAAVVKQTAPAAPAKPTASFTTSSSVTLNAVLGHEYAMLTAQVTPAANDWQDSPVFTGLTSGVEYFFYARVKETPERYASAVSPVAAITAESGGEAVIDLGAAVPADSGTGWSYASETQTYTITDGADVRVVGVSASGRRIVVAEGATAAVTLDGASITGLGDNVAALTLGESAAVTLHISGTVTLAGGANASAIDASAGGAALTLAGNGVLNATGGGDAKGISGGVVISGGSLNIAGGSGAFATQPKNSAGDVVYMNTLTLHSAVSGHLAGGSIPNTPVTGVTYGGTGYAYTGAATDAGSKVYLWLPATSSAQDVTVRLKYVAVDHTASGVRPTSDMAQEAHMVSELVVKAKEGDAKYTANYTFDGAMHTINGGEPVIVTMRDDLDSNYRTGENISATGNGTVGAAAVTIKDVRINTPAGSAFGSNYAANTLTLEGDNYLQATSLTVGTHLTIDGDGSLTAYVKGTTGASTAIGCRWSGSAQITINSGNITASGASGYGASFGLGAWSPGSVTINGGSINTDWYGSYGAGTLIVNGGILTGGSRGASFGEHYINGGSINLIAGIGTVYNSAGQRVYKNTLTVGSPGSEITSTAVTAATIGDVTAAQTPNAAAGVYGIHDVKTDASGNLYVYLPVTSNTETGEQISVTAGGNEYKNTYPRYADDYNEETLYPSDTTPPQIAGSVTIGAGDLAIGTAITAAASVTDNPQLRYTWFRGNDTTGYVAASAPSTSESYTPQLADAGYYLKVRVTASGYSGAIWSSETAGTVPPLEASLSPGYSQSPGVSAIYGQTLQNAVIVPSGWAFKSGTVLSDSVGEVGAGKSVTLTYSATGYETVEKTVVVAVSPKPITVSGVKATGRVYDGTSTVAVSGAEAALSGVLAGDVGQVTVNVDSTGTLSIVNAGANKTVAVNATLAGEKANNYVIEMLPVRATITRKTVTPSGAVTASKTYDGTAIFDGANMVTTGVTFTGKLGGDVLTLSASEVTGSLASASVGSGSLVVSGLFTLTGADSPNYTLMGQPPVVGTITPGDFANVTLTPPTAADITYGQTLADSALTGGDARGAFAWTAPATRPSAGAAQQQSTTFTPNAETRANYALAENYTAQVAVLLTVNKAAPAMTLSAVYDTNETPTLTATASLTGAGGGAAPTGSVAFSYVLDSGGSVTIDLAVAISGGTASAALTNPVAGNYTFTAVYSGDNNYSTITETLAGFKTDLTQQTAPIEISGDTGITYGDTDKTLTASGGNGGGAFTFSAPQNDYIDVAPGGAITVKKAGGPVTVTAKKAADATYNEATATAQVTVSPRPLAGAAVAVSGSYPYTGAAHTPAAAAVAATLGGNPLEHGVDYTFSVTAGGTDIGAATVTATGRGNYTGTVTGTFSVIKAVPDVTLSVFPDSGARYGQTVTLRAQARNKLSNDVPTGYVGFKIGDEVLGTVALDANGDAEYSYAANTVGSPKFSAAYQGDDNYSAAASSDAVYPISRAERELDIQSASLVYGSTATLTAIPSAGAGDGAVTFSVPQNDYIDVAASGAVTIKKAGGPVTVTAVISGGAYYADAADTLEFSIAKLDTVFTASQYGGVSGKLATTHIIVEFDKSFPAGEFSTGNIVLTGASVSGTVSTPDATPAGYTRVYPYGSIYLVPVTLNAAVVNGGTAAVAVQNLDNHTVTGAQSRDVTVYKPVKAAKPQDIGIDYVNERLTGLASDASYVITPAGLDPVETGTLSAGVTTFAIPGSGWFGKTLSIVRRGGAETVDSDPYTLAIPSRPQAPTGLAVSSVVSGDDAVGTLSGLTTSAVYEYTKATDQGQPSDPGTVHDASSLVVTFPQTSTATVRIRLKATGSSFAGEWASYVILSPGGVDLGDKLEGYTSDGTLGKPLTIADATITEVAAPPGDAWLTVTHSAGVWTVAAKTALAAGEYDYTLSVTATVDAQQQTLHPHVHFTVHQNAVIKSVTTTLDTGGDGATDKVVIEFEYPVAIAFVDVSLSGAVFKTGTAFADTGVTPGEPRTTYTVNAALYLNSKTGDAIPVTVRLDAETFAYQRQMQPDVTEITNSAAQVTIPRSIKSAKAVTPVDGYSTGYIQFTLNGPADTPPGHAIMADDLQYFGDPGGTYDGPIVFSASTFHVDYVMRVDADMNYTYRVFITPTAPIFDGSLTMSIQTWGVASFPVSGAVKVEADKTLTGVTYIIDGGGNNYLTDIDAFQIIPELDAQNGIAVPELHLELGREYEADAVTAVYVNGSALPPSLYASSTGSAKTFYLDGVSQGDIGVTHVLTLKTGWADPDAAGDGYKVAVLYKDNTTTQGMTRVKNLTASYVLTVNIDGGQTVTRHASGESVGISAPASLDGGERVFHNWTASVGVVANASAASTTYTMPQSAAAITANYRRPTPAITVNYEDETLDGFIAGEHYKVETAAGATIYADMTAAAGGKLDINNEDSAKALFGKSLKITRLGGGNIDPSAALTLTVAARPAKPAGLTATDETFAGFDDGTISGVTAGMEYHMEWSDDGNDWTVCTSDAPITGLAPGDYYVRYRAVPGVSFKSESVELTVAASVTTAVWQISLLDAASAAVSGDVSLGTDVYGYAATYSKYIVVKNTGNQPVSGLAAALSGDGAGSFTVTSLSGASGGTLAPNETAHFTVAPVSGLAPAASAYAAVVTVSGDPAVPGRPGAPAAGGVAAGFTAKFTVNRAPAPAAVDLDYTIPTGHVYDGATQGIGTVALKAPYNSGAGAVTVYYTGTGGTTYSKSATAPTSAGTYVVAADVAQGTLYEAASGLELGNYAIAKKTVSATGVTASKVYDGNESFSQSQIVLTGVSFPGKADGDTLTLNISDVTGGTVTDADVGTRTLTLTGAVVLAGASAANYTLTSVTATATITKDDITFAAVQHGGVNGKAASTHIDITFNKPVADFAASAALISGGAARHGTASDVSGEGAPHTVWRVPISLDDGTTDGTDINVKVQNLTNYNVTGTNPASVTVFKPVKEQTPAAKIDYVNERLIGLAPSADYTMNGIAHRSDDSGVMIDQTGGEISAIPEAWHGGSIPVVKLGGEHTVDSDAQSLSVPARPGAPAVTGVNTTDGDNGSIAAQGAVDTSALEWRPKDGEWRSWSTQTPDNLAAGEYHVRTAAKAAGGYGAGGNFRGSVAVVHVYTSDTIILGDALQGYAPNDHRAEIAEPQMASAPTVTEGAGWFDIVAESGKYFVRPRADLETRTDLSQREYAGVVSIPVSTGGSVTRPVSFTVHPRVKFAAIAPVTANNDDGGLTTSVTLNFEYPTLLSFGDVEIGGAAVKSGVGFTDDASGTPRSSYIVAVTPKEVNKTGDAITVVITPDTGAYLYQTSASDYAKPSASAVVSIPRSMSVQRLGDVLPDVAPGYSTGYIQIELGGCAIPPESIIDFDAAYSGAVRLTNVGGANAAILAVMPVTAAAGDVYRVFISVTTGGTVSLSIPSFGVPAVQVEGIKKSADLAGVTYFLDGGGNNYLTDENGFQTLPESDALHAVIAPDYTLRTSEDFDTTEVAGIYVRNKSKDGANRALTADMYTAAAGDGVTFYFDGEAYAGLTEQLVITLKSGWAGVEDYGGNVYEITVIFRNKTTSALSAALGMVSVVNVTRTYDLTVVGGELAGGEVAGRFAAGSKADITAPETIENDTKVFWNWTAAGTPGNGTFDTATSRETKYTMPDNNATATAVYAARPAAPPLDNSKIDYQNRTIALPNGPYSYTLSDGSAGSFTVSGEKIDIDDAWFGKTLTVRSANAWPESVAAPVFIEQIRPEPGGVSAAHETFAGFNDGELRGVTSGIEFRASGDVDWTSGVNGAVGLAPGVYVVRLASVAGADFYGRELTLTVDAGAPPVWSVSLGDASSVTFTMAPYGYYGAGVPARDITVTNNGNQPTGSSMSNRQGTTALSVALALGEDSPFVITGIPESGIAGLAPGDSASFTVKPKTGLAAGHYEDTLTVTGDGNGISKTLSLSFTVSKAEITGFGAVSSFVAGKAGEVLPDLDELGELTAALNAARGEAAAYYDGGTVTASMSWSYAGYRDDFISKAYSPNDLPYPQQIGVYVFDGTAVSFGTQSANINSTSLKARLYVIVNDVPRAISLDAEGTYLFDSAPYGYDEAPAGHAVTVTNQGTQATGELTAELGGAGAQSFELTPSGGIIDSIAIGAAGSGVTVRPKTGLPPGEHRATLTVRGAEYDNINPKSYAISFTVRSGEITGFEPITAVSAGVAGYGAKTLGELLGVGGGLPAEVTARATHGLVEIPVTEWTPDGGYDATVPGSYVFTATLGALPQYTANPHGLTAQLAVTVAAPVHAQTPVFTVQPAPYSGIADVTQGAAHTLTAEAAAADGGAVSYKWYTSAVMDYSAGSAIADATASEYDVPVSAAGTVYYWCETVNNNASATGDTESPSSRSMIAEVTLRYALLTVNGGTASPGADSGEAGKYAAGETVTITADPVGAGKMFDRWEKDSGPAVTLPTAGSGSIVMPADDVTLTALYRDIPPSAATDPGSGAGDAEDAGGTDGAVTANGGLATLVYSVADGMVTVELPAQTVREIIGTSSGGEASIDVSTVEGAEAVTFIPKSGLSDIADAELGVVVVFPLGAVALDVQATKSLVAQAAGTSITLKVGAASAALTPAQTASLPGGAAVYDISAYSGGQYIHSYDGDMLITVPYEDRLPAGAWYLDDGGTLERVPSEYSAANKTVTFKPPHLSLYVVGYAGLPFEDVKESDWFFEDVEYVYGRGLMTGTGATVFDPQGFLTRAMLVTILYRLDQSESAAAAAGGGVRTVPADGAASFDDVPADQWYTDAVRWAASNGIVLGVGDNKFAPDRAITRQELATMLYRYAVQELRIENGEWRIAGADISGYADAGQISDWAYDAMAWANATGLITGRTETTLAPRGKATRAETAAVLRRFIENVG